MGTKMIMRILHTDTPEDAAREVADWIRNEMAGLHDDERDTEITVVIGLDPS